MAKAKTSQNLKSDLETAFNLFNQCADTLTSSYRALEQRVSQLKEELEAARDERLVQLQEKERLASRLSDLLSALPAGVVVIDGRGVIQECNPAADNLLGIPLVGELWREIILRAFKPDGSEGNEAVLRDGRIVSISTCPLGKEPGQIIHLLDVTETRRLQNSLTHYKRLSEMGEMSAKIAHQIRTPLSAALLYVSQLTQFPANHQERNRLGEKVMSRLRHMEQVVEDMLAFSRNGDNDTQIVFLSDLVEDIRLGVELQLEASGTRLYIKEEAHGERVSVNRHAVASALQNLITNAIQACVEAGEIWLSIRAANLHEGLPAVDIILRDNGPGIPKEKRAQIFEPFYTTREQGTGLGLAVAKAVVESCGGSICLDTSYTSGACFIVRLPVLVTEHRFTRAINLVSEAV